MNAVEIEQAITGSKTGKSQVIKSHHDVGGLPREMVFRHPSPVPVLSCTKPDK